MIFSETASLQEDRTRLKKGLSEGTEKAQIQLIRT